MSWPSSPNQFWGIDFTAWAGSGGTTAADPQLQFFENFPGHLGAAFISNWSNGTLSVHAVNIPLSISMGNVVVLASVSDQGNGGGTENIRMGLYSLNANTLSLANSASYTFTAPNAGGVSWYSLAVSNTSYNISPGPWYFALLLNETFANQNYPRYYFNSSINPGNAIPGGFLMGRMTASTGAMPESIATSNLDITGSDAIRQPYIIITA